MHVRASVRLSALARARAQAYRVRARVYVRVRAYVRAFVSARVGACACVHGASTCLRAYARTCGCARANYVRMGASL
eukprot:6214811-Pleurochrysis_carterae.AAC.1